MYRLNPLTSPALSSSAAGFREPGLLIPDFARMGSAGVPPGGYTVHHARENRYKTHFWSMEVHGSPRKSTAFPWKALRIPKAAGTLALGGTGPLRLPERESTLT